MEDEKWVIQIQNILEGKTQVRPNTLASIFQIPSSISQTKPEAYTPQVIALGPYQRLRTKPYHMQNCKLDFALKAQQTLGNIDFEEVNRALKERVVDIRACYDWQNFAMGDDTFLCIVALDGLFLLQLLENETRSSTTTVATGSLSLFSENASLESPETRKIIVSTSQEEAEIHDDDEDAEIHDDDENAEIHDDDEDAEICDEEEEVADEDKVVEMELNTPQNIEHSRNSILTIASKAIDIKSRPFPEAQIYDEDFDDEFDDDEEVADDDEVIENELNTPQNIENNETPKFIDAANKEHSVEEILGDIVMLENQIPTIALKAILIKSRSPTDVDRNLVTLCLRLSPTKLEGDFPPDEVYKNYHLLDALYILVWFGMNKIVMKSAAYIEIEQKAPSASEIWSAFWSNFKQLNIGPISVFAAVVDLILNSLKVLGISVSLDFSEDEFLVPSASELKRFGVKFLAPNLYSEGGIKDIIFDDTQLTLELPVLNYNVKLTEVVIRNLLAYEALTNPECPKFGSFIELMCSLIRSIEDVEVLKVAKVVPSDVEGLKAKELVKLLDELVSSNPSKSKSKASSEHEQAQEHTDNRPKVIKDAIDGVNKYYNNRKEVRTRKIIKKYLSVSWKVLTVLALVLLLVLMALQTFCSFYGCSKIFKDELRSTLMGWI